MVLYMILVSLTAIGGFITTVKGWQRYKASKQTGKWPSVNGVITFSQPAASLEDLPRIKFSYELNGQRYEREFIFPRNDAPLPELALSYSAKYPLGEEVEIFYDPDQPAEGILEHDDRGDWIVLFLGVLITLIAIGALIRPM